VKIKQDLVTNSSSTSFIITNTSDKEKTLEDFVRETWSTIEPQITGEYGWETTMEEALSCTGEYEYSFPPLSDTNCVFGDEDGNALGNIYDYVLRDGGKTKNFKWRFKEYFR